MAVGRSIPYASDPARDLGVPVADAIPRSGRQNADDRLSMDLERRFRDRRQPGQRCRVYVRIEGSQAEEVLMPRGRKARVEGAKVYDVFDYPADISSVNAEVTMADDPVSDSETLHRILNEFRANFPDKWEEIARCPTQHGV